MVRVVLVERLEQKQVADVVRQMSPDAKNLGYQQREPNDLSDAKITETFYIWINMVVPLPCVQIFHTCICWICAMFSWHNYSLHSYHYWS